MDAVFEVLLHRGVVSYSVWRNKVFLKSLFTFVCLEALFDLHIHLVTHEQ